MFAISIKKHIITPLFLLFFFCSYSYGQKVSNYSVGKPGTNEYEHLSFWTKSENRAEIYYSFGKNPKDLTLKYIGVSNYEGKKFFIVELPNHSKLYVMPLGLKLTVIDAAKKYNKTFAWAYEGPVNGVGTFCSECAEDENEAIDLIKDYFMK